MDRDRTEHDPLIPPPAKVFDYRRVVSSSSPPPRAGRSGIIAPSPTPPSYDDDNTCGSETSMRRPQHVRDDSAVSVDDDVVNVDVVPPPTIAAALASRGPSRQLFYRDRIPHGLHLSASEPREYVAPMQKQLQQQQPPLPPVPQPHRIRDLLNGRSSSSSTDTSDPLGPMGGEGGGDGGGGGFQPQKPLGGLPPPRQLHEDYSHRLHRNQVAQGHQNFVVGGAHGRYRDYGGTLVEVPEEVYAVRQAALTVLDPITYCWLILTPGFSVAATLGVLKWTDKLGSLPYWAIFLPAWISHVGILAMHVQSARALSKFISDANNNRQRQDSTDHLDRVEYLPLLQRSLKFGLKTGILCFVVFIFEILLYLRLVRPSSISLGETYIPLWILTIIFIANGIVCKSQHYLQSLVWALFFTAMLLSVLLADYGIEDAISTNHIILVIIAMLAIVCGVLIYIVYGHQIGFYKLTEAQLTASVFYSASSFLAIIFVAIMGDAVTLPDLIRLDLLLVTVLLAPIVVALVGFGAYFVSRDEFERLLKYGGQSAVLPMKLKLETNGWTSVVSKGAVTIPMLGDVKYVPLDAETAERLSIEICGPCCCYPTEEDDEMPSFNRTDNYQSPTPPNSMEVTARWGGSEAPIV